MTDGTIFVTANIQLLPTAEGGRTHPLVGGGAEYRPNHNFFSADSRTMAMGAVTLPEGAILNPGEDMDLPVKFFYWPELKDQIYPGRKWRIQEGARLVGIGTVIEILPNP